MKIKLSERLKVTLSSFFFGTTLLFFFIVPFLATAGHPYFGIGSACLCPFLFSVGVYFMVGVCEENNDD